MGKVRDVVLPAADLGTDPISQLNKIGGKLNLAPLISQEKLTAPTQFEQSSKTKIDDLSDKQLNKFYLSNPTDEASMKNEMFAEDQGTVGAWGNGLGKFIGKTGTAVAGGTVGLLYGLGSAITNGEFNKFYDNDVNKALDSADKWMDEKMQIYQTKEASENAWYEQAAFGKGFAKFWADDVLGGLSFTAGAVLSESIWGLATAATFGGTSELLAANTAMQTAKAANLLKKITKGEKLTEAGTFARQLVTGSGYEAGVEARHTKSEIINNMKKEYLDAKGVEVDEKSPEYAEMLNKANQAANSVFAANIAILSAGNAVALPKTFGALNKGFGKVVDKVGLKFNPIGETSKISEVGLERAAKIAKKSVEELKASQFINKWDTYSGLKKGLVTTANAAKSPISEGLWEEGMQGAASEAAKMYVARKYDPSGIDQTVSLWDSIGDAMQKTYGSEEGWKDIGVGMIIGAMGLPHIGHKVNEEGKKVRDFSWEGGIYGAKKEMNRDRAETNDIVELMNSNKALVSTKGIIQAAVRTGSTTDGKSTTDDLYTEKNKESEDFFNYVHSRHKGGYFANIKDELAEGIKNMKPDEFADAFGYTNMTESELKTRQQDVVRKTVERADKIKKAIEIAERVNKVGQEDVTEGLAYSISQLDNIDERQTSLTKRINDALDLNLNPGQVGKLNSLSSEIKNKTKELTQAENRLRKATRTQDLNTIDDAKDAHNNIIKELEKLKKEATSLEDKKVIESRLKSYSGDLEDVRSLLNTNNSIKEKLQELSPEKVDDIREAFTDLQKLDERRQALIESYNNLKTKEGQIKFTEDMENFKSYLFADIPEGLTKRSATLAYYQKLGESIRGEMEQNNTLPSQQSISGQRLAQNQNNQPPQAVMDDADMDLMNDQFDGNFEPLQATPPIPTARPVTSQPATQTADDNPFGPPQTAESLGLDETEPQGESIDDLFAQIATATNQLGDNAIVQGAVKNLTKEQVRAYSKQMQDILDKLVPMLEKQKSGKSKKELVKLILDKIVGGMDLTEQKFNVLLNVLNNEIAGGVTEQQYTPSQADLSAYKGETTPEELSSDLTSNQVAEPINKITPEEYGHDKNKTAATSLAYKSHEYTEENGRMQSTGELAENSQGNNQFLLTSNEVFTSPESIKAQTQIDLGQPFNPLTLDFDIKIQLEDKGQKVTTSIHDPAWLLQVRDKKGNTLTNHIDVETAVQLARNGDLTQLTNHLNQLVDNNSLRFRNVAGSNAEIAQQLIELVAIKDNILASDKSKPMNVTVTKISPGKVSFLSDYKNSDETLTDENLEFAIIGQNGELMASSEKNHSAQSKNMASREFLNANKGATVVLIPTRDGKKVLPIAMRVKSVQSNSKEQKIFFGTILEFLSQSDKTIKVGNEKLSFKDSKDAKKIISIFASYLPNISKLILDKDEMKNYANKVLLDFTSSDSKPAIQLVIPNVIVKDDNFAPSLFIRSVADLKLTVGELAKKQKLKVLPRTLDKSSNGLQITEDTKIEDIVWNYSVGKKMFTESSIGRKSLLEGKVEIPNLNVDDKNRIQEVGKTTYQQHLKERTTSNVRGTVVDPMNKDKRVYWEQPVYQFAIDYSQQNETPTNTVVQNNTSSNVDLQSQIDELNKKREAIVESGFQDINKSKKTELEVENNVSGIFKSIWGYIRGIYGGSIHDLIYYVSFGDDTVGGENLEAIVKISKYGKAYSSFIEVFEKEVKKVNKRLEDKVSDALLKKFPQGSIDRLTKDRDEKVKLNNLELEKAKLYDKKYDAEIAKLNRNTNVSSTHSQSSENKETLPQEEDFNPFGEPQTERDVIERLNIEKGAETKEAPIAKVGETIEDDLFGDLGDSAIAVSKKFKIDYSKSKQESVKKQEGDCD